MLTIPTFKTKKALKLALKEHGVNSIFSVGSDAKTIKGEKLGYDTGIMYMQPDRELCPASKLAQCEEGCLNTAGRAGIYPEIQISRTNKSNLFKSNPALYLSGMINEITFLVKKFGDSLVIRPNGTSDTEWESIPFEYKGKRYENIFELFPYTQFYDYTKMIRRTTRPLPYNYDLTISYSGANLAYASYCMDALRNGERVAVVFRKEIPATWRGFEVINGDETDLRFLDRKGVVVGLKAKGKAKKDKTGFVQDIDSNAIDFLS